jgi:hypothetical protein
VPLWQPVAGRGSDRRQAEVDSARGSGRKALKVAPVQGERAGDMGFIAGSHADRAGAR